MKTGPSGMSFRCLSPPSRLARYGFSAPVLDADSRRLRAVGFRLLDDLQFAPSLAFDDDALLLRPVRFLDDAVFQFAAALAFNDRASLCGAVCLLDDTALPVRPPLPLMTASRLTVTRLVETPQPLAVQTWPQLGPCRWPNATWNHIPP